MKSKKIIAIIFILCLTAFIGVFSSCSSKIEDEDNTIVEIYRAYVLNAEENGEEPLNYEKWLESIKESDGKNGDNGLSAFEIYKKYHPDYTGTEQEWIDSLASVLSKQIKDIEVDVYYNDQGEQVFNFTFIMEDGTKISSSAIVPKKVKNICGLTENSFPLISAGDSLPILQINVVYSDETQGVIDVTNDMIVEGSVDFTKEGIYSIMIKIGNVSQSFDITVYNPISDKKFVLPLTGDYKLVRTFGEEMINGNEKIYSTGISYAKANNSVFDVIAINDGVVISILEDELAGDTISIRHSDNIVSIYSSLANVKVKVGDRIEQGTVIAEASTSIIDTAAGVHVHLEIKVNDKFIDPSTVYGKNILEIMDSN